MRNLPPIPWSDVRPGAVVLFGIPRTVAAVRSIDDWLMVFVEGMGPFTVKPADLCTELVELDAADAIGSLYAAGLNPRPIGE